MASTPINVGPTTQIPWAGLLSSQPIDPYLVWADVTGLKGLATGVGVPPLLFDILVKTATGTFTAQKVNTQALQATITAGNRAILCAPRLANPVMQMAAALHTMGTELLPPGPDVCIGIIDDGCPFLSPRYRTNLKHFWDQGRPPAGVANWLAGPTAFGYGRQCAPSLLSAALTEPTGYQTMDYWDTLKNGASHGAHLLDVIAGNPNPLNRRTQPTVPITPPGLQRPDSTAPLVFVQLPRETVRDTSGGSLAKYALDAVAYIINTAKTLHAKRTVICLAYGTLAGPHDGTSLFEEALDQLIAAHPDVTVVLPAGNGHLAETHASASLASGKFATLAWRLPPDNVAESFMEIWLPLTAELESELTSPSGNRTVVRRGAGRTYDGAHGIECAVIYPNHAANGTQRAVALLAVSATSPKSASWAGAEHGNWTVRITNTGNTDTAFEAWIERCGPPFGIAQGGRQSRFTDTTDATNIAGHIAPDPEGTLSGIATGSRPVVVGAVRSATGALCDYSAALSRNATRNLYTTWAEESRAHPGLLAHGTLGRRVYRMNGTSVAAAVLTRAIANLAPLAALPPLPPVPTAAPLPTRPPGHRMLYANDSLRKGVFVLP